MLSKIKNAKSVEELSILHTDTFGKNGTMTARLKQMKDLSMDERAALNSENTVLREAFKIAQEYLENAAMMAALVSQKMDPDANITNRQLSNTIGGVHPLTQSLREISKILTDMGYDLRTGPEIEDDFHNFTALNTPKHHPARDMQDSFFLPNGNVLRTQTSAIQIRAMEQQGVPIKIFGIGATYRREMDATHSPMFHQIEGLYIDSDITLQDLISDVKTFLAQFFGLDDVVLRVRPSYFPFTEPSIEIDMQWEKNGKQDWLEIMGAGMVHPNVLKNVGVDSNKFQGFAFGFGWDRLAMLKYGLPDLRKFFDGDIRWLQSNSF